MTQSRTDPIRKEITLRAPRSRVWRALTNAEEFGTWFRAKLDGELVAGKPVTGRIAHPGRIPAERRDVAFRRNGEGWAAQMENIARHVGG